MRVEKKRLYTLLRLANSNLEAASQQMMMDRGASDVFRLSVANCCSSRFAGWLLPHNRCNENNNSDSYSTSDGGSQTLHKNNIKAAYHEDVLFAKRTCN
eukprot:scaffold3999_cov138-Skeletonema_dohrnii-CCMP3373.AAC.39